MGKTVGLSPVPTAQMPNALPYVAAKLRAVYAKTHFWMPFQKLVEHLMSGKMQLWVVVEDESLAAVFCTRIYTQYGVTIAEIVLYSGEMDRDIIEQMDDVEMWAREHGAEALRFEGREGWKRWLKGRGYSIEHVAMFKLLEEKVS